MPDHALNLRDYDLYINGVKLPDRLPSLDVSATSDKAEDTIIDQIFRNIKEMISTISCDFTIPAWQRCLILNPRWMIKHPRLAQFKRAFRMNMRRKHHRFSKVRFEREERKENNV